MFSAPPATTTTPARTRWRSPSPSTYSTPVASPSSTSTRSTQAFARSSSASRASASAMYVFIVDLPAFVEQPCRHEPHFWQFGSVYACTASSGAPSSRKAASSACTLCGQSVRSRIPSTS